MLKIVLFLTVQADHFDFAGASLLVAPRVSELGPSAFHSQAHPFWIQIPVSVYGTESLNTSKTKMKTFLYEKS